MEGITDREKKNLSMKKVVCGNSDQFTDFQQDGES